MWNMPFHANTICSPSDPLPCPCPGTPLDRRRSGATTIRATCGAPERSWPSVNTWRCLRHERGTSGSGRMRCFETGAMALQLRPGKLPDARLAYGLSGAQTPIAPTWALPQLLRPWPGRHRLVVGRSSHSNAVCVLLVKSVRQMGAPAAPAPAPWAWPSRAGLRGLCRQRGRQQRLIQEVVRGGAPRPDLTAGRWGRQQAPYTGRPGPERVERICCLCGTARTRPTNRLVPCSACARPSRDPAWDGTRFRHSPEQGAATFA